MRRCTRTPRRGSSRRARTARQRSWIPRFAWTDGAWAGVELAGQVLYEMHVGTFTPEGTWAAARPSCRAAGRRHHGHRDDAGRRLSGHASAGATTAWTCSRRPGSTARPTTCARFVDRAHAVGHGRDPRRRLQPRRAGRRLPQGLRGRLLQQPLRERVGRGAQLRRRGRGPVREFFVANAGYWIDEFHFDGLRLDATQAIHDASPEHILAAIGRRAGRRPRGRSILLVAENESQEARLVRPLGGGRLRPRRGCGTTTSTTAPVVALTGHNEAYYTDYLGRRAGVRLGREVRLPLPGAALLLAAEDARHADLGHPARRLRHLHREPRPGRELGPRPAVRQRTQPGPLPRDDGADAARLRARRCSSRGRSSRRRSPFLYFADHRAPLADAGSARAGASSSRSSPAWRAGDAAPACRPRRPRATFERCKLDFSEREPPRGTPTRCTATCSRCGARTRSFAAQRPGGLDGAVLGDAGLRAPLLRPDGHDDDRLLLVNLGRDLPLRVAPEPLLAPPAGMRVGRALVERRPPLRRGRHAARSSPATAFGVPGEAAIVLAVAEA